MMRPRILVIGLGSVVREDDGIGSGVIQILRKKITPSQRKNVTLKVEHQIDIVQAALLKEYSHVIFVDAHAGGGSQPFYLKKISPDDEKPSFTSHIGSIPALLHIAARVFGRVPDCYLVAIRGNDFAFGQKLSNRGQKNAALGARATMDLISQLLPLA